MSHRLEAQNILQFQFLQQENKAKIQQGEIPTPKRSIELAEENNRLKNRVRDLEAENKTLKDQLAKKNTPIVQSKPEEVKLQEEEDGTSKRFSLLELD